MERGAKRRTNFSKNGIQGSCVICDAISLRIVIFHADELTDWIACILRMRSADDSSRAIENTRRLVRSWDITLCKYSSGARSSIYIALTPRRDRCSPSIKNDGTAYYAYSNRHVIQFYIVEHERSCREPDAGCGSSKEDRSVRSDAIYYG